MTAPGGSRLAYSKDELAVEMPYRLELMDGERLCAWLLAIQAQAALAPEIRRADSHIVPTVALRPDSAAVLKAPRSRPAHRACSLPKRGGEHPVRRTRGIANADRGTVD